MNGVRLCFPIVLLVAVLLLANSFFRGPAFAQDSGKEKVARPVVKWEYKVTRAQDDSARLEDALNKLGEDGWECAGTVMSGGGGFGPVGYLICKRPKQ